ncbi:replication factor C large subunit [Candidatus Woesearchaeota archaeon]|nr:replication factor C large subunit [Candidatus Woesearchaeota archaeon]
MEPFFLHRPDNLSGIIGQDEAIKQMKEFFKYFQKGKGLFLFGPPGVGKTASVYAYATQHNYEILELNASDARNQATLKEFLSNATGQASLFGNKKIILLDEVDGLSGTKDRGAPSVIADFIKRSTFPMVMTGVNVFDKKFSSLKKTSMTIQFNSLATNDVVTVLQGACMRAKINCDEKILKTLARQTAGDARGALNDLFAYLIIKDASTTDMDVRRKTQELGDVLVRVFKSTDPDVVFGSYDYVNEDLDKIFLWVDENLPKEYTKPIDVAKAYETLSLADIFFGRIRRWQYYRYYAYCYLLLSVGIALSKDEKSVTEPNYHQPTRLLRYWQANMMYAKRKVIIEKIADKMRISKRRALQDVYPFLLNALAHNAPLQDELELDKEEVAWLKKQVA